jgi:urease accessory protein UreF
MHALHTMHTMHTSMIACLCALLQRSTTAVLMHSSVVCWYLIQFSAVCHAVDVGHRASVRVYSLSNCSNQCNSSNRVSVLNSLHTPQSYILYCCTTSTTQTCYQQQYQTMLHNTEYRAFLDYMCPGAAAKGLFPPPGSNPSVCPR